MILEETDHVLETLSPAAVSEGLSESSSGTEKWRTGWMEVAQFRLCKWLDILLLLLEMQPVETGSLSSRNHVPAEKTSWLSALMNFVLSEPFETGVTVAPTAPIGGIPKEDLFLTLIYSVFKGCDHIANSFHISGFLSHRFLPYVGMVTIIMNDYPKFKVGIYEYLCVCLYFCVIFFVRFFFFFTFVYHLIQASAASYSDEGLSLQTRPLPLHYFSHHFKCPILLFFLNIFIDYAITVVLFPPLHSTLSCPPPPSHIPPL